MPVLDINLEEDNFISQYVSTFMQQSSGHPEFKYGCAVTALSIAVDRRVFVPLKHATKRLKKGIVPNVWMLLIGQSSSSGKTTCFDELNDLIQSAGIGHQMPNTFSRESLSEILCETPICYYLNDEIAGLLKDIHKNGGYLSGLSDELCKLYDNPGKYYKRLTQKKGGQNEFVAENISISFLGATTPLNFKNSVEPGDLESGLLARYLISAPTGTPEYQPVELATVENMDDLRDLTDRYKEIWDSIHLFQNLIFKPSARALTAYNEWQKAEVEKVASGGDDSQTLNARLRDYSFKLACLYYIGSQQFRTDARREYESLKKSGGNLTFMGDPVQESVYLAEFEIPDKYFVEGMKHTRQYFIPTSTRLLGDTIQQNDNNHANSIINVLKRAPEHTLSRSELLRKLSRYIHAAELDRLIQLLRDELIIATSIDHSIDKNGRARNTTVITLIGEKELNI